MIAAQDSVIFDSSGLGPLYEPEAIGFSFQSPGWYVLAGLLLLLALFIFVKWLRTYLKNAYRREALKHLVEIETGFAQQGELSYLREALVLLKKVAIDAFGREKVAQLHGDEWLIFLEERGKETPFWNYSTSISAVIYKSENIDTALGEQIIGLSKRWIKTHA